MLRNCRGFYHCRANARLFGNSSPCARQRRNAGPRMIESTQFAKAFFCMSLSVFDIFKIGIGPSSSHTMGPMNAARSFAQLLADRDLLRVTAQVSAQLYGSLALTGRGHCTDRAILLGLEGMSPDTIDPAVIEPTLTRIRTSGRIRLLGRHEIAFDEPLNLLFHTDQVLPGHSNGMRFTAHDSALGVLAREEYYSVGGGFVVQAGAESGAGEARAPPPYEFESGARLLELARQEGLEIHELMLARERTWYSDAEIRARLARIWQVMQDCVQPRLRGSRVAARRARCAPSRAQTVSAADERRPIEPHARPRLGQCLCARRQRGKRRGRTSGHGADQRRSRDRAGGAALLPPIRSRARTTRAYGAFCSRQPRSACSTNKMRRSPAPRWVVRVKSVSPARWRRPDWCRR